MVSEKLGARLVAFDDFEQMTRLPPEKVHDWIAQGADYAVIPTPGLAEAVEAALRHGDVVLDTPLARADPHLGAGVTFAVWLEVPADTALVRKLSQFAGQVPAGQESGFIQWLRGYLDNYGRIVQPAIETQRRRVRLSADLRLDATRPARELVSEIVKNLDSSPY